MKYRIAEIFGPTIQGEGSHSGKKAAFIRFAGCNLECDFCDTDHSEQMNLTAKEIVSRLPSNTKIVVLTGGEPLLQIDKEILSMLKDKDFETHLETNGTIKLNGLSFDHITVSPKKDPEETIIEYADDLKLLYPTYDPSKWNSFNAKSKYLQPISENGKTYTDETLARVLKESDWHLSIQLHKILGVP